MPIPAPAVPPDIKDRVDRWADAWLTAKLTRLLALRAQNPGPWNYPTAVFSEWRGRQFYLNVRYKAARRATRRRVRGSTHANDADRLRPVRSRLLPSHRSLVHDPPRADRRAVFPRDRGQRDLLAYDVRVPFRRRALARPGLGVEGATRDRTLSDRGGGPPNAGVSPTIAVRLTPSAKRASGRAATPTSRCCGAPRRRAAAGRTGARSACRRCRGRRRPRR